MIRFMGYTFLKCLQSVSTVRPVSTSTPAMGPRTPRMIATTFPPANPWYASRNSTSEPTAIRLPDASFGDSVRLHFGQSQFIRGRSARCSHCSQKDGPVTVRALILWHHEQLRLIVIAVPPDWPSRHVGKV